MSPTTFIKSFWGKAIIGFLVTAQEKTAGNLKCFTTNVITNLIHCSWPKPTHGGYLVAIVTSLGMPVR